MLPLCLGWWTMVARLLLAVGLKLMLPVRQTFRLSAVESRPRLPMVLLLVPCRARPLILVLLLARLHLARDPPFVLLPRVFGR